jgi:hypothetical protein
VWIEIVILNPRGVLEVVDHAADWQAVELIIKEIVVGVLRAALAAEDPYVMTSKQPTAKLVGILLNASGGRGRKSVSDLKDSLRIDNISLSSLSASRAVGLQPRIRLGKTRLGSGTQVKSPVGQSHSQPHPCQSQESSFGRQAAPV